MPYEAPLAKPPSVRKRSTSVMSFEIILREAQVLSRSTNAVPKRIRATISVNREQVLSYPDAPLRAVGTVRE